MFNQVLKAWLTKASILLQTAELKKCYQTCLAWASNPTARPFNTLWMVDDGFGVTVKDRKGTGLLLASNHLNGEYRRRGGLVKLNNELHLRL
jgi:hypothetical protein